MGNKIVVSLAVIGLIWMVFIADMIIPADFNRFGIFPRTISGLYGIPLSPFLHANIQHILSNSLPLFFLTFTLLVFYERIAFQVWVFSAITGGLLVWVFARQAIHIGASGVIFSLISFLIASGIFRRSFISIIISLVILLFYGGAIWGVLPTQPGVSWEAHLFGFLSGIFFAYVYKDSPAKYGRNRY